MASLKRKPAADEADRLPNSFAVAAQTSRENIRTLVQIQGRITARELTRAPDSLSSLELTEQPGQRITYFRRVAHSLVNGLVELQPGERVFAIGAAHHDCYAYVVESDEGGQ